MAEYLHFAFFLFTLVILSVAGQEGSSTSMSFPVGVILDLDTLVGKMGTTSISMAVDDFYTQHPNYRTRLAIYSRDSNNDVIQAASEALDLLGNIHVQAIIGPQKSAQARFISNVGNKSHVPIVSFSASSPLLSSRGTPYFMRMTLNDSGQVNAITWIIRSFGWRQVVPIYEDTDYGRDIVPYFVDALQAFGSRMTYRSVIELTATDDQIMEELHKLMTMQTRVFVVHMSMSIGVRVFLKAKEVGMMSQGYAWIMTDGLTSIIDSLDSAALDAMQGALGVKVNVPMTRELNDFSIRWRRRFLLDHPRDQPAEPSNFALWAYDTVWALAIAAEKVGTNNSYLQGAGSSDGLKRIGISPTGPKLLSAILSSRFKGISGYIRLIDKQLPASTFQVTNVVGRGTRVVGSISKLLDSNTGATYPNLNPIIWPGQSTAVPKGWGTPVSEKKLKIGVPVRHGFSNFVNVQRDPKTNATFVTGYCIDIFEAVMRILPYAISYEYVPYDISGSKTGDELVHEVFLRKFDGVVGDLTITRNRSGYVDFTLPYTESGVAMLVPVKAKVNKNAWIFLKPLKTDLWLGSLGFFIFTGFVVWIIERMINTEFSGPINERIGTVFYFAFSTLVFAHRERVQDNLARLVLIVWLFVVLIITSSFTASLASIITVQQLEPMVNDVQELRQNGNYVGYTTGSFVEGLLKRHSFDESKLKAYFPDDYADALSKGSHNGGVSAIVDEIPYIKLFLSQNCSSYKMVGPIFETAGFGFVFPRGSELVTDISRAILNVTEGNIMTEIENKWFGNQAACLNTGSTVTSNNLSFKSFWGLFLITGTVSTCSLMFFLSTFIYNNWNELGDLDSDQPIHRRLVSWWIYFHEGIEDINRNVDTGMDNADALR